MRAVADGEGPRIYGEWQPRAQGANQLASTFTTAFCVGVHAGDEGIQRARRVQIGALLSTR